MFNSSVVKYKDPFVIAVLEQKLQINKRTATRLFGDTVKFLFLCSQSEKPLSPPVVIDKAWHEFITCTENYQLFSEKLGIFINHRPALNGKVQGVDESLNEIHSRTLELAKKTFGKLSINFYSGVDGTNWCCHSE